MYGLASKLIIAARVIRIIWAIMTNVKVIAGSALLKRRSAIGVLASTLAKVGKTGQSEPKIKIKT